MSDYRMTFEEILDKEGQLVYTNKGYSMFPLIRQNRDILIISRKPSKRLKKDDVVLFKRNGKYILHRIIKVKSDCYNTAGDHNWWIEKDIKDEEIIGVLSAIVRDGKKITTEDLGYNLYVTLWCNVYKPIRTGLIKTVRYIKNRYLV